MELLVCLKQVPDDSVEIGLDPASGQPKLEGVTPVVNPFDTYALEMAVRLKEAQGGAVTALTAGPAAFRDGVKSCLSVGADRGCVVEAEQLAQSDTLGKSRLLAAAIDRLQRETGPFDLIFCGREATDRASGQTGPQLAEALGLPVITDVVDIAPAPGGICARQETEDGYRLIEAPLPCVVTVNKPAYDPRYPTIKSKMAARKAVIPAIPAGELGQAAGPAVRELALRQPPRRQAGLLIREESAQEAAAKAVDIMAQAKVL